MSDPPPELDDQLTDDTQFLDPTAGDLPEVSCSLTADEVAQRKQWIEANLLPHLVDIEARPDGFSFVFDRNPDAYAAATELSWKEAQCCAWATFEVELPPDENSVRWNTRSAHDSGVELFSDELQEMVREYDEVPPVN
ncbi:hypothetical protein ACH9L7_02310 [Haloferax sp. S1W]|uniref:hypothetical protein n=1 Tax=Haloferax sp. S1W TaxID=3377110 RepID=UPI0037C9D5AF